MKRTIPASTGTALHGKKPHQKDHKDRVNVIFMADNRGQGLNLNWDNMIDVFSFV